MESLLTISGRTVSEFSFGTMQFGGGADEAAAFEIYGACREVGINFFDTAYLYAEGRAEEIIGQLVAPERDDIFLATKCGYHGASAAVIDREFSESRRRLGCETLDLLYVHRWDAVAPLNESLGALAGYVRSGAVRYVGLSNFAAWQVMKAVRVGADLGLDVTFLQPMYNLVKRQAEVEILPMAEAEGFAVCPYSPLGGGLLTGKYAAGETGRLTTNAHYASRYREPWMATSAASLAGVAARLGVASATLAVAWAGRHPGVWGPIISARSLTQIRPSLAGVGFEMDDALYQEISALSPTPPPATDRTEVV
ncbi:aldo/keto reductase [Rhodobacteraceae bacterium]|nr:aldo/keto reductase [Paracoccaceae bacterium]